MISSKTFIAFTKFGIVGGISFFVDMSVYYGMSQFMPTYFAKAAGIMVATLVNYKLNKYWTWESKKAAGGYKARNETLKKYLMLMLDLVILSFNLYKKIIIKIKQ